ncbi:Leucine-rich repeat-containing protein 72 [Phytophthora nicotianae]|uniref:Leucine-rich repeat-containing protein 72 n=1 Tax=Phytophthora nicotianae TaxID=4792 RepID=A0A0W8CPA0_PHYNI|nr:Leucine-rich repeat-containing protein 72 [Phytophthora nicotianae]
MSTANMIRKLRLSDPHAELPIKNHKYVKNCTELYMANKRIHKIANFDAFVNLEVLWINDNQIQELNGLDGCFRLKQLYAHKNCIRSLEGSSLPHFKFLLELRLYDNKLKDLQGALRVLSRLSHLRDLDLFGNPVVEEENYRLQVIRAIPSLDVLDRHVITDEERAKAARLQVRFEDGEVRGSSSKKHGIKKSKKRSSTVSGAPPQALSGTVKMLFKEVAAIKREQQREAREAAKRELQELGSNQQALSTTTRSRWSANNNNADEIPGLGDWEVTALKKHFRSLEEMKNGCVTHEVAEVSALTSTDTCSGLGQENLAGVFRYLRSRGYTVLYNGFRFEGQGGDLQYLENILPAPGKIQWKPFVQLFESNQLRCELLSPQELRHQAAACFDKCAVMQRNPFHLIILLLSSQRRLQALNTNDAKSAQLVKESLELSQQGYHLQALADSDHTSSRSKLSRMPSSAVINDNWEATPMSTPHTRFYMTTFTREKFSALPSVSASRDCSFKFNELRNESERISDALAGKYKIRHKDFKKYLVKQSPQTTKLVRRNYQL